MYNLVTLLRAREADVAFYLTLLAIWNPEWEGFNKDFVFRKPEIMQFQPMVDNSDCLYENLPELPDRELKRTRRMRIPKDQRLELQMTKLKLAEQRIAKQKIKLQ